jgi:hypothetical protein
MVSNVNLGVFMRDESKENQLFQGNTGADFNRLSGPSWLLGRIADIARNGVLQVASFSGLVVKTDVSDMERGLIDGGDLSVVSMDADYRGKKNTPLVRLENDLASCIYSTYSFKKEGREQLRETIDMVRKDMPGGVILAFVDGRLVGGITNAVRRVSFDTEEQKTAERLLRMVRDELKTREN